MVPARPFAEIVEQANLWRVPTVAIERPDTVASLEALATRRVFVTNPDGGFVQPREGQALKWVKAKALRDYPMPPADAPLIPHLVDLL